LLQNYNNWECFIVDDDSIDKTNAVKHSENINNLYQNSFNEKLAVNSNNII
jgi:glycosyltransferase involved in cell wall biosynthesis